MNSIYNTLYTSFNNENNYEFIYTIAAIVTIVVVIIISVITLIIMYKVYLKKPTKDNIKEKKNLTLEDKIFKRNLLFDALGGEDNIIKIENKNEYLIAYLRDDNLVNINDLKDYGCIDIKIKNNEVLLYFLNVKEEYDHLFGK